MFSLFKKKLIRKEDYSFLESVVGALPANYAFLKEQVNDEFILDKKPNPLGDKGTYTLTLNANYESKYSDKSFPQLLILKDIQVWNRKKMIYEMVEIHLLEGMIAGFFLDTDYKDLDLSKIEVQLLKEKTFKNEDKELVKEILGEIDDETASILDINSSFKIEIEEGDFYTLKELGDGNYLAMNQAGMIYGLFHDPYDVDLIFDSVRDFINAQQTGMFNIEKYVESKNI
ncbi:hypothetical protein [Marinicella sp. W31]|uniref:hypothetical protein n=1 Tax=Marinicella sp. W31 TaxID=3023713 RepID=UPI003757697F